MNAQDATKFVSELSSMKLRPRDTRREKVMLDTLRGLSSDTRLKALEALIKRDEVIGLELARRSLSQPAEAVSLFRLGLPNVNRSSIDGWLAAVAQRMGQQRLVDCLEFELPNLPRQVSFALYFLPKYLDGASDELRAQVGMLRERARILSARLPSPDDRE